MLFLSLQTFFSNWCQKSQTLVSFGNFPKFQKWSQSMIQNPRNWDNSQSLVTLAMIAWHGLFSNETTQHRTLDKNSVSRFSPLSPRPTTPPTDRRGDSCHCPDCFRLSGSAVDFRGEPEGQHTRPLSDRTWGAREGGAKVGLRHSRSAWQATKNGEHA